MLLKLPESSSVLLASFKAKLRSQIRKPVRDGLTVQVGGKDLLDPFYRLFSINMRDLGSPVHSEAWLRAVLGAYGNRAHLVLVRMPDKTPAAGGILLCHPNQVSVPWASALRCFNRFNPNMLLYWTLLSLACDLGYPAFDFGRSTPGEGTYRFKAQWGARPGPLHWSGIDLPSDRRETGISSARAGEATAAHSGKARAAAESVIQKMPLGLLKVLGPNARKYISL
jgi:lipid II:glycine glycyltransferase (peptidoglycan interpeptide bridge formation enzyme)